jgi:hypothetical protein
MKPMRFVTIAVVRSSFALTILAMAAIAAPQKQTFTGTITDSICTKADHSQMRMGPSDASETNLCCGASLNRTTLRPQLILLILADRECGMFSAG